MPNDIGSDTDSGDITMTALGRDFVQALNEGLSRSVASHPPARLGHLPRTAELSDPYAAAVLGRFRASLTAAVAPAEQHDATVRSALVCRAVYLLADAFGLPASPRPPVLPPLPARQEALVGTLLLECAATVGLADGPCPGSRRTPAELVRILGRSVREPSARAE
ncbi:MULTISPECIES: hypothetical protein [unclassified Streptomyces]|uniref:hypothetical protein n=1 Tax=unclassified Streptomyces TaxID=2593676 RepID=UPI0020375133|nr:hypothetical protein [Streptomyces sp. McG3]